MSGFKIICNNCDEIIEIKEQEIKGDSIKVYSGHKEIDLICKCGNTVSCYAIS
jgi:hypothetical protein